MYSLDFNEPLVKGFSWEHPDLILTHEKVVEERCASLINYLESLKPYVIVPSILVCDKTNVIIDGHHRYFALKKLGFEKIPTIKLNYSNHRIITDLNEQPIKKEVVIQHAVNKNLLEPKSTFHHIVDVSSEPQPIILLSSLAKLEF
ncbi:hypothetical protein D5018_01625 [Parashewanella curva]|uniref:ParB/Sulfiredoxin domain-containing protein n=1 Tax=Parashewanella curva TaxID=2338552 RepID=A0A3L8Q1A1_9GAMM|nr:ParB N-terminal domain-containing protein [Parashewanella curva]RLV61416.1 hypothetical protein D5018_01625 [Parashewanella curva]